MSIIGTLPNTLANGTIADATQVMADFNLIVNDVNANAASLAALAATTGSSLLGFLQSGTGARSRTVQEKLRELGVFASDFTGYDVTGSSDSAAAIQAAINASEVLGFYQVFITGTPKILSALTYNTQLSLVGIGGGYNTFVNDFDKWAVRIKCGGITGYVFDQPDVTDGSGRLSLTNLCFDGRTSGSTRSTTLQGLVKASSTSGKSCFYFRTDYVAYGHSDATTAALKLDGEVFSECNNLLISTCPLGYGLQAGGSGLVGTTITFNKSYFTSVRQCYEVTTDTIDVIFNDTVFESSVVVGAAYKCNVTENNCYHENIGYDASGTGLTTGLTGRDFGEGDIAGNVAAAYTCRFGQMVFNQPTILATVGGMKWWDGIGRTAGGQSGGCFVINDLILGAGSLSTIFASDGDSPSSRNDFEYYLTSKRGTTAVFTAADARMLTKGRVPIIWSDGNARPVEVVGGIFTLPSLAVGGLSALPTIYPNGGANAVGDQVKMAPTGTYSFQQGIRNSYICTIAGTTASRWDINGFIPSSLSASVVDTGTLAMVAYPTDNPGEVHIWEVLASTGANIESFYRVTMQAFSGTGQIFSEGIVTTKTLAFAMSWGGPYTITCTNTSGVTLNIYARLVSVSSTHT